MPTPLEVELTILKRRAKVLAVLALQSNRAHTDMEFKDASIPTEPSDADAS